jgi:hypothetical protein
MVKKNEHPIQFGKLSVFTQDLGILGFDKKAQLLPGLYHNALKLSTCINARRIMFHCFHLLLIEDL